MNYMLEILAFYDWLLTNPISADAQALWHALMHINNKCCWLKEFTVSNTTLLSMLDISQAQLHRVRLVLIQKGRISYMKQAGRKAGIYSIIKFVSHYDKQYDQQPEKQSDQQPEKQTGNNQRNNLNTLIKLNNIDNDDDTRARSKFIETYEQEFGNLISPTDMQMLESFIKDGMDEEVVCEAIRRARTNNVLKMRYVTSILNDWFKKRVTDMAGVSRADLEFEQQKAKDGPKGQARAPTGLQALEEWASHE